MPDIATRCSFEVPHDGHVMFILPTGDGGYSTAVEFARHWWYSSTERYYILYRTNKQGVTQADFKVYYAKEKADE